MNEIAFLVGTVVSVGYYFYMVRKERAARGRRDTNNALVFPAKGGDN